MWHQSSKNGVTQRLEYPLLGAHEERTITHFNLALDEPRVAKEEEVEQSSTATLLSCHSLKHSNPHLQGASDFI